MIRSLTIPPDNVVDRSIKRAGMFRAQGSVLSRNDLGLSVSDGRAGAAHIFDQAQYVVTVQWVSTMGFEAINSLYDLQCLVTGDRIEGSICGILLVSMAPASHLASRSARSDSVAQSTPVCGE